MFFLGLLSLASFVGVSQPLREFYPVNAYLVFKQGLSDKADTYYRIPNLKIYVNNEDVGERIEINSNLELQGFAWTQSISNNVFDFITPKPQTPQPDTKPKPEPDNKTGRVRLNIPGYDEVSDIFLADESLKQKDPNRLNIQLATHSISLGQNIGDRRSKVNYKITDQTGKIWVEVLQKETTIEGYLGGRFGNNHPDRAYIKNLTPDCNIYLPLEGIYTVEIETFGDLNVEFSVIHPSGKDRSLHVENVPPRAKALYNIDVERLGLKSMPDYQRTIKINVNGKL